MPTILRQNLRRSDEEYNYCWVHTEHLEIIQIQLTKRRTNPKMEINVCNANTNWLRQIQHVQSIKKKMTEGECLSSGSRLRTRFITTEPTEDVTFLLGIDNNKE